MRKLDFPVALILVPVHGKHHSHRVIGALDAIVGAGVGQALVVILVLPRRSQTAQACPGAYFEQNRRPLLDNRGTGQPQRGI